MDSDFHYFGTGTAAVDAGFDASEAQVIAFAAQFVDWFDSDYWSYWQIVKDNGKPQKHNGKSYRYDHPQLSVQSISPKLALDFQDNI